MKRGLVFAGLLTLAFAWTGPLPELAHQAFFGHMTMHMLNVALAAPLLALGIAGTRFDPVDRFPRLFAPIPASVVELIIVWGWHAPLPHHYARMSFSGLAAEQLSFLFAGVWVWLSAFGGRANAESGAATEEASVKARRGAGVIGLLLTSMHMTLLGALLGLSPRPLYSHHHGFGTMSALGDQHLGGAIMLVAGSIAYLSGGLWLTVAVLRKNPTVEGELS